MTLSDRIAILSDGRILQVGRPAEVYERPQTSFAARFLGDANFLDGRVIASGIEVEGIGVVRAADRLPAVGEPVRVAIRPEKFAIGAAQGDRAPDSNRLRGVVRAAIYSGTSITYKVELRREGARASDAADRVFTVFQQNRTAEALAIGAEVELSWAPVNSIVLAS